LPMNPRTDSRPHKETMGPSLHRGESMPEPDPKQGTVLPWHNRCQFNGMGNQGRQLRHPTKASSSSATRSVAGEEQPRRGASPHRPAATYSGTDVGG